jgi:hypothetical protein
MRKWLNGLMIWDWDYVHPTFDCHIFYLQETGSIGGVLQLVVLVATMMISAEVLRILSGRGGRQGKLGSLIKLNPTAFLSRTSQNPRTGVTPTPTFRKFS